MHWSGLIAVSLASTAAPQPPNDPAAVALIEQSIAAHRLGPLRVRLSYRGTITGPDQSAVPDGPHSPHPWSLDIAMDDASGAFALGSDVGIDGGFTFPRQVGFAQGRGFATRYTGEYETLTEMPAEASAQLPHLLLRAILNDGASLRLVRHGTFDTVGYRPATGGENFLLFDPRTHLLAAHKRAPVPSTFGDRPAETVYGPYRRVDQVMVPESLAIRYQSPALGSFEYSLNLVSAGAGGPTAAELSIPPGATPRVPTSPDFVVERLGEGVYLLRNVAIQGQFSYNVLVVVFADQVMVVEAALNDATSQKVIGEVGRLAPGKPIRTLVQTHHHGDHIGGIRTYIARGTHIIAPAGMRAFVERIASTDSAIAPDALTRFPRPLSIEELPGDRTVKDSSNEVRLLSFPNAHSGQMLVIYLPRQKVLYQGDLISAGELPLYSTSRDFLGWLTHTKIPVQELAGLHGRTVRGAELELLMREANPPESAVETRSR